jgi:hypothetical protein
MMLERYLEAAQKVLDRVIVTPPLVKKFLSAEMAPPAPSEKPGRPLRPGEELSTDVAIFVDGQYQLRVSVERPRDAPFQVDVKVDGSPIGTLTYPRDLNGGPTARTQTVKLERGVHKITVAAGKLPLVFYSLTVEERQREIYHDQRALHYRLFQLEPGQAALDGRAAMRRLLDKFLPKAYRRPVTAADVERILTLYDRAPVFCSGWRKQHLRLRFSRSRTTKSHRGFPTFSGPPCRMMSYSNWLHRAVSRIR